jgi:hypothetical protein
MLSAQYTIKGKIVDVNEAPLESVNITLLENDSVFTKGTVTGKNGAFELKGVNPGNYLLKASFVSYAPLSYAISGLSKDMNLETIVMEESAMQIGEVSVVGRATVTKADRIILFPSDEQLASSANAIVLLSSLALPRLLVNQATNSVSLPGNEAVELRINGVVAGNDEVRALPPNTIERIEYIDNPGLRYGEANAVLNYIIKRRLSGGNVRLDLSNSLVRINGSDLFSAKINYKKSEFGLSYLNDFRDYYNYERNNTETFYFDNYMLKRIEESRKSHNSNIYQNIVLNYNLTHTKSFLNVSLKYQGINSPHEDYNSLITVSDDPVPVEMKDYTSYNVHLPSLDVYFERTLTDKQKLSVNVVATDRYQDTEREYEEIKNDIPYAFSTLVTSNAYSIIGEGIYEYDWGKGKLTTGLKHLQKWMNNDYQTDVLSHSSMQQSDTYLYSEYAGTVHRLNYTIGIGGKRSGYSQDAGKYAYYNFQPTLGLFYRFNDKGSFRYRLNIYNDVPSLAQLTDADVWIDSLQIRRGNPALTPGMSYNNTALVDYSVNNKLYLSLRAVHWYSSNFTQENTFLEGNKVIRSYQNSDNFQRLTFDFYSRLSLINNRFILSANCGMHRFSASGYIYTAPYYYLNAQFNYKNWQLYAMLYDQGAGFSGEIKYIQGNGNYLGVQYSKKNYVFGILLANMFIDAKTTTENISRIAPYTKIVNQRDMLYALSLKFAMNIDFGRKFTTGQQRISNSDSGSSNTLSTGK